MLDKQVFKTEVERLLMFYPNWNIKTDDSVVMKAWYDMFKHITENDFVMMIDKYINCENFNPTVSGLKKYLKLKLNVVTSDLKEYRP